MRYFYYIIILFVAFISSLDGYTKTVSPIDYGFLKAVSGEERYEILYKTHMEALKIGADVDYSGIKIIELVVPHNAKSIPLTDSTNFRGAVFIVKNRQKDIYLFTFIAESVAIAVNKKVFGKSKRNISELARKSVLLSITDKTPWVKNRRGYSYGATRKDIIVVKNGIMKNLPVMPYNNVASDPKCGVYTLSTKRKTFKNVKLIRSADSDHKTFLLRVEGQYNMLIADVCITTPNNTLNADAAIKIDNSAKVVFRDVTINGTYSQTKKYGYGISLDNVYDVSFVRLKTAANWGVFGNNNVQKVVLEDCDINRFDIHCYGKDVYCKNTIFRDLYNQYSSFYGTLRYENCTFLDFVPVLFESSYSAYTYFKLEIENCSIDVDARRPYLIYAGNPSLLAEEPRQELANAYWPDIEIKNLTVNLPEEVKNWTLFQTNAQDGVSIDGLSNIKVEGLEVLGQVKRPKVRLSNRKVTLKKMLETKVLDSNIKTIESN